MILNIMKTKSGKGNSRNQSPQTLSPRGEQGQGPLQCTRPDHIFWGYSLPGIASSAEFNCSLTMLWANAPGAKISYMRGNFPQPYECFCVWARAYMYMFVRIGSHATQPCGFGKGIKLPIAIMRAVHQFYTLNKQFTVQFKASIPAARGASLIALKYTINSSFFKILFEKGYLYICVIRNKFVLNQVSIGVIYKKRASPSQ